jgi:two-component system alkaline phosphatase synthesis response regulator PhoP
MNTAYQKRILVADDELSVRSLLRKTSGQSYTVLEASDGDQAVDMARREKPDLILMDIMMPKLDGIGACNIIKSNPDTRTIPVVMVTARWQKLDQEYAEEMGADGYIVKPFRPCELMSTVSAFLKIATGT